MDRVSDTVSRESEREALRGDAGPAVDAADDDGVEAGRAVCPGCGATIDEDAWSCHACGAPVVPKSPPQAKHRGGHPAMQARPSRAPHAGGQARSPHEGEAAAPRSRMLVSPTVAASGAAIIVAMLVLAYVLGVVSR